MNLTIAVAAYFGVAFIACAHLMAVYTKMEPDSEEILFPSILGGLIWPVMYLAIIFLTIMEWKEGND